MDAQMPDWIKQRETQEALTAARSDAKTQRVNAALMRIKHEGVEFWRQLLMELKTNVDALALSSLDARGRVSSFDNPQTKERSFRVEMTQKGSVPGMTYTDLFYGFRHSKIRSLTLDGESLSYVFCVSEDEVMVMPDNEYTPKTAEEVAEAVVKAMLDRVCETVS